MTFPPYLETINNGSKGLWVHQDAPCISLPICRFGLRALPEETRYVTDERTKVNPHDANRKIGLTART